VVRFVRVLGDEGVTYIYRQIDCPSVVVFIKVLEVERVTYIY
jgi:hypothetical protein